MSELENPHYHRKAGYAMIMVAASLAAIGLMHITIGEDVLFADTIQREKTQTFEDCKLFNFEGEDCQKYFKAGNTLEPIPRLNPDGTMDIDETEILQESEPVAQVVNETVIISIGSGTPGCEEANECYIPYSLNIVTGTGVTWENADNAAHTVTSGTPDNGPNGNFDSSIITAGATFNHEFSTSGEELYYCIVHPWMTGIIIVE
jgi:plastocyanin|tara:strand:+ start:19 stop:630 length:612 start_codon:yes stop_codon:yes gene_type:complete